MSFDSLIYVPIYIDKPCNFIKPDIIPLLNLKNINNKFNLEYESHRENKIINTHKNTNPIGINFIEFNSNHNNSKKDKNRNNSAKNNNRNLRHSVKDISPNKEKNRGIDIIKNKEIKEKEIDIDRKKLYELDVSYNNSLFFYS
jgi:hypothetical protein